MVEFFKKLFGIGGGKDSEVEVEVEAEAYPVLEPDNFFDGFDEDDKPKSAFTDITEPRASFTVTSIQDDRIKVEFDWNKPFIDAVKKLGFEGETEEDIVQMFFYASSMRPSHIPAGEQDLTSPAARLTDEANRLVV